MSPLAPRVSVIVPTLGRPAALEIALRSVLAQTVRGEIELLVVDNDPALSAAPVVERLQRESSLPVRSVSAPAPGVSNARNAGVVNTRGALIAFLDDDQSASPTWLERLLAVQTSLEADVVFGPVAAQLPPSVERRRVFFERFFSRLGPERSGFIPGYYGCGNCLIVRAALPDQTAPFSKTRNEIGGEDDLLFQTMQAAGARFAWAADAVVAEHVPEARAQLSYVLRRAFAYGQGPTTKCAAGGPRLWPMIPVWMTIGVGQALAYGAAALAQTVLRLDEAATLNRAAQGLGKLLWFPPFKLAFYGQAPAQPPAPASP